MALQDDYISVRVNSAKALSNMGPEAKIALPDLKKALEKEKYNWAKYEIEKAIKILDIQN